jgi:hypothetical protein
VGEHVGVEIVRPILEIDIRAGDVVFADGHDTLLVGRNKKTP